MKIQGFPLLLYLLYHAGAQSTISVFPRPGLSFSSGTGILVLFRFTPDREVRLWLPVRF